MLISFTVENFRSIRDRQTLSFLRAGGGAVSRVTAGDDLAGGDVSPLAVVFGANASGKSTVLDAVDYVRWVVRSSARLEVGEPLPLEPFHLDASSRRRPFSTEMWFTIGAREFEYSFTLRGGVVKDEQLREAVRGPVKRSVRTLFSRTTDGTRAQITTSSYLPGAKKAIIAATRPNSLFLSKAAQENFEPLLEVYDWFTELGPDEPPTQRALRGDRGVGRLETDPAYKPWIVELLRQADFDVTDVDVAAPKTPPPPEIVKLFADSADTDAMAQATKMLYRANRQPRLWHQGASDGSAGYPLPWVTESRGTQSLWDLASDVYGSLSTGRPLFVDELSSLHPVLVRAILEMYQFHRSNPHGAQLVFTSHDISLLGSFGGQGYVLDRDQIWFTEKDPSGATALTPLTDYKPRRDEDTERMYIQARFGAVPSIGQLSLPFEWTQDA